MALGPDCKRQVTVEYDGDVAKRIDAVVLACQHTEDILDASGKFITKEAKQEMIDNIAMPIVGDMIDADTKFYVNETGKFVVGGPQCCQFCTTIGCAAKCGPSQARHFWWVACDCMPNGKQAHNDSLLAILEGTRQGGSIP